MEFPLKEPEPEPVIPTLIAPPRAVPNETAQSGLGSEQRTGIPLRSRCRTVTRW
jgi:hypothetical protein